MAALRQPAGLFAAAPLLLLHLCLASAAAEPTEAALQIASYVRLHRRPSVKTFRTKRVNHTIDCVRIEDQPSLQSPFLQGHKIQYRPSAAHNYPRHAGNGTLLGQSWGHCPSGTIPVRRYSDKEIEAFGTLPNFLKKHPHLNNASSWSVQPVQGVHAAKLESPRTVPDTYTPIHEYAIAQFPRQASTVINGAQALFNTWSPYTEIGAEFSLAQLWLVAGSYTTKDLNTIEAGWQVYKDKYGDTKPRLFIYWTSDAYGSTGCYNLDCPGFIQTNSEVYLGGAISPTSTAGSSQFEFSVVVKKDWKTGNWWLQWQGQDVGYWPSTIFSRLGRGATAMQFGGEMVNSRIFGRHSRTVLGSGNAAKAGWKKAAYIRNIAFYNRRNVWRSTAGNIAPIVTNARCYSVLIDFDPAPLGWGSFMFYGGPGYSSSCL